MMIRQASLFGRLLVSVRGMEAAAIHGIIPSTSRLLTIDNRVLPCVVTSRTFSVTEKLREENKSAFLKVNQNIKSILAKNSTEDILNGVVSSHLDPKSVILVLKRLTDLKDDSEYSALETDRRFIQLMDHLESADLSPYDLIESLSCLLQLTREDHNIIIHLEMRVREMLFQLKFSQLLRVVQMHKASRKTSLRQSVCDEAMTVLERRWVEIMSPKDLVSVLYIAPSDREKLLLNLEQKTLELSEAMNVKDLYRILYLMAKRNRLNVPVIRSLVYHMNRLTLGLTPIQLANLSYACVKLNIYEENIMGKITEGVLLCKGDQASMDELTTVLRSFGMLQWCDQNLMDGVAERFMAESSVVPPDCWAALLLTAGSVSYLPSHVVEHLPEIISKVETVRGSNPRLWLDVVWSLLILLQATPSMVSSVLSPDFISSIKGAMASQNQIAAYMKLMNINAIARFGLSAYSGPFLGDGLLEEFVKQLPTPSRNASTDCLVDTLSNMANLDKYVRTNVKTSLGFVLDAEVIVKKATGELQPVEDKGSGSSNSLPESLNRVAIKLMNAGDMTRGTSVHPTGLTVLQTKCLTSIGYKIVQIPYEEFNMKMTTVKRVQYLNMKIKESLGLAQTPLSSAGIAKAFEKASSSATAPAVKEEIKKKPIVDTESVQIPKSITVSESKNAFVRPTIKDIFDADSSPGSVGMAQASLEKVDLKATGSTKEMKDKKSAKKNQLKK